MSSFISEDELLTFDGFLKYEAIVASMCAPHELKSWRDCFDDNMRRFECSPKVGLMKLARKPGQQLYAVAISDASGLWSTLWVKCSPKGDTYVFYARGDGSTNAHTSYHNDGSYHSKTYGMIGLSQRRQPLTGAFTGCEHLGMFQGHGKSIGAVCDPCVFDGVVRVEANVLGPRHGAVGVELVAPGHESMWNPYANDIYRREVFLRQDRPSVVITIMR